MIVNLLQRNALVFPIDSGKVECNYTQDYESIFNRRSITGKLHKENYLKDGYTKTKIAYDFNLYNLTSGELAGLYLFDGLNDVYVLGFGLFSCSITEVRNENIFDYKIYKVTLTN